jgi:glycosyltransferase involved in cell wall biosynthesis
MKIGVDVRSISGTGRGVSHYAVSLLREMTQQGDDWRFLQTGRHDFVLPEGIRGEVEHIRTPNKLLNAAMALTKRPRVDTLLGGLDVVFAPNFGFLPIGPDVPLVVTVHDLSFETHREFYSRREQIWHRFVRPRGIVQRANRLIAVSEQTKQELIDLYGVSAEKIAVVHSGIDARFVPATAKQRETLRHKFRLPERFILYIGALEPRKNVPLLVDAWRVAKQRGLRAELVLAGPAAERIRAAFGDDVTTLGYVDDALMPALYSEATAVALVSHHEGFGFPPLEALACGTPSVVSDLPVFSETLGAAAVRVPKDDIAQLADALVNLEGDERMRQQLLAQGAAVISRLTWQHAAEATYAAITEAAHA